jgi:branched-chain amino acid transport system permease protein
MISAQLISSLFAGIAYGLTLSLIAAGLSLIYGVMKIVNTSHGAFYILGGFFCFSFISFFHLPLFVSILLTATVTFVIAAGVVYYVLPANLRVTVDPDGQNTVMITFMALATIVEYLLLFTFGGSSVAVPSILPGSIEIFPGVFIVNQLLLVSIVSLFIYLALYLFLKYTRLGRGIYAFAQNKELAEALGLSGGFLACVTFGIGCTFASTSGALLASVFSINSSAGWSVLPLAFVIVTLGGIGNIFGSLAGGLIFGIVYSVGLFFIQAYSIVMVLLVMYGILLIKPTGLLGGLVERV